MTTIMAFNVAFSRCRRALLESFPRLLTAAFGVLFLSGLIVSSVRADGTYYNFASGNLKLNVSPTTTDMITKNDDWSGVPSVEGYCGNNLTATHGIDPQTVLTSEYATLPSAGNTCVNANKGNPSAFNAGGITEFDRNGTFAIGFQGNVQANPYLVFYLNTVGQSYLRISYDLTDIDSGSNNSVSPIALQFRVGETGAFTNVSAGHVTDVTDGPNASGRLTTRIIALPASALNQPKLQIRLITTNAAAPDGTSTPDEWIGLNNVVISNLAPTAANVTVAGRAYNPSRKSLANAKILMYDNAGGIRMTLTDADGFYSFDEVTAGETYVFEIRSKKYVFPKPTRILSVTEDYNSLNFFAGSALPKRDFFLKP